MKCDVLKKPIPNLTRCKFFFPKSDRTEKFQFKIWGVVKRTNRKLTRCKTIKFRFRRVVFLNSEFLNTFFKFSITISILKEGFKKLANLVSFLITSRVCLFLWFLYCCATDIGCDGLFSCTTTSHFWIFEDSKNGKLMKVNFWKVLKYY